MGQTDSSGFHSQYPSAGENMTPLPSQYNPGRAQEPNWSNEYYDPYRPNMGQMGSPGVQRHNSALTDQAVLSHFPGPYATPTNTVAESELQVNPDPAAQSPYPEPASPSTQDEMPKDFHARVTSKSEIVYHGSYGDKVDSNVAQPEPKTYNDGNAIVTVASSSQSRNETSKRM